MLLLFELLANGVDAAVYSMWLVTPWHGPCVLNHCNVLPLLQLPSTSDGSMILLVSQAVCLTTFFGAVWYVAPSASWAIGNLIFLPCRLSGSRIHQQAANDTCTRESAQDHQR